jgi:hypothetical protein
VIALSRNEIAHLFAAPVGRPIDDWLHRLRWSWRRRRHHDQRSHLPLPTASHPTMKVTTSDGSIVDID